MKAVCCNRLYLSISTKPIALRFTNKLLMALCTLFLATLPLNAVSDSSTEADDSFQISPGLNDAWYNPDTAGQGYFITVLPKAGIVFLSWFTYDTDQATDIGEAHLGEANHRWVTAQGPYDGNSASLTVYISSGGQFDTSTAVENRPEGTITLSFDSCNSGLVEYDFPSIGKQGSVPIERVVPDNAAWCQSQSPSVLSTQASSIESNGHQSRINAAAGAQINPGLNDAWYNPDTAGQGYFITVLPKAGIVFLSWFTYDTDQATDNGEAHLGEANHRWVTAQGPYDGNSASLTVYISSGGQFDTATAVENRPEGTITLSFDSCNSGLVEYDIPSIGKQGSVPIERVVPDNVGLCEEQQPPPVVESWKYWQHEDVKTLDVWGETADEHSDLVALYEKEEPSHIALRVDYMNLTSSGVAPTFLGLDFKSGGVSNVIQGNNGLNLDIAWDVLIVADGENISAFDTTFTEITAVLSNLVIDRHVDYLSLDLDQSALPGWGGGEFSLQALTTNANRTSQRDATPVAQTDDVTGRGKFVLTFMNAFATDRPWGIYAYDGYSYRHEERPGERRGLRYLLDAAEKYDVPVQIADLRVNNIGGSEFMGINDRFRDMFENDQIDLLSNHDYGQHMVWWPDEVNRAIQDISLKLKARMDLPSTETVYPYESIIRVRDIAVLKEAGFTTIWALDQYPYWFGVDDVWGNPQLMEETNRNLRKIHRMNGMNVVFETNTYLGHVFDQRWEGEEEEWSMDWISKGTDQGLHHWYRRTLLDLARNEDQQQFVTFGTDIGLTHWVYQAETDWSFKWLAAHPWIDVTTFNDIGSRGWGVIDHGTLDLDEDDFLQQYEINNEGLMDYFTQNYYGGISSGHSPVIPEGVEIEALYDYVPYLRDGQFIPSGRIFGDYKTPGSIVYETLSKLRSAPNNDLRDLAWLMFSTLIAEVTLHEAEVLASGGKQQANWLGHVGKIVAAAHWAEATEDGEFSSLTVTRAEDLDLDGEDEYIIHNDQVFAVFENDGGYLEYAFAWSSEAGPVQLVAPLNQRFRYFGSGDFHSAGEIAFIAESGGTASFFDTDEKDGTSIASVMAATVQNDALVFTEPNGLLTKRFTLAGDTLTASYSLTGIDALVAGFCFTTNMMAMYEKDWHDNFKPVEKADFTGWQTSRGGYAGLNISGLGAVSFLDSPVADEKQEREDPDSYPEGHWSFFPWGCVQTWLGGSPEFDVGITLRATSEIME